MPKKMTPKSQANNETPIPTITIFNYFLTLKKFHTKKYTILSFIRIMRYIVMYIITLYTLNYYGDKYFISLFCAL